MKNLILLTLIFLLPVALSAQSDYDGSTGIPNTALTPCAGDGMINIIAQIIDSGTGDNGIATDFAWTSSNANIALVGTLTGIVANNTTEFKGITVNVAIGTAAGAYTVTCALSHSGGMDVFNVTFMLNVKAKLTTTIANGSSNTICPGSTALLSATPSGAADSHQWYKGGVAVGGEISNTITVLPAEVGTYTCTSTNDCGEGDQSNGIVLVQGVTTTISSQNCVTAANDNDYTVTVVADGTNLTFQWRKDGANIANGGDFAISGGSNNSQLDVINVEANHENAVFSCLIIGDCGTEVTAGCVALPVEMVYFKGKKNARNNDITLKWATQTEINNESFLVERSFDGKHFQLIETIKGGGTSYQLLEYTFVDNSIDETLTSSDHVFYRLKQVDVDGHFAYTEVITLAIETKTDFAIGTIRTAGDMMTIDFLNVDALADISIAVYDVTGKMHIQQQMNNVKEGKTYYQISTVSLPTGLYILTLSNGKEKVSRKLIVQ